MITVQVALIQCEECYSCILKCYILCRFQIVIAKCQIYTLAILDTDISTSRKHIWAPNVHQVFNYNIPKIVTCTDPVS